MNKPRFLLFSFLLLFLAGLSACQQEIGLDNENFDYIPTSPGSAWRYNSTRKGRYDLDATTRDTMISGYKYRVFDRLNYSNGLITHEYYGKTNKTYRTYGTPAIVQAPGEIILLKDTVINGFWTSIVDPGNLWVDHHKFTVIARDIQYTVNNLPFDNVIRVDYEWGQFNPNVGTIIIQGSGKFYFARGVGLIESICEGAWGAGRINDTIRIYSYRVKP
jgi:hypothetical protein